MIKLEVKMNECMMTRMMAMMMAKIQRGNEVKNNHEHLIDNKINTDNLDNNSPNVKTTDILKQMNEYLTKPTPNSNGKTISHKFIYTTASADNISTTIRPNQ